MVKRRRFIRRRQALHPEDPIRPLIAPNPPSLPPLSFLPHGLTSSFPLPLARSKDARDSPKREPRRNKSGEDGGAIMVFSRATRSPVNPRLPLSHFPFVTQICERRRRRRTTKRKKAFLSAADPPPLLAPFSPSLLKSFSPSPFRPSDFRPPLAAATGLPARLSC